MRILFVMFWIAVAGFFQSAAQTNGGKSEFKTITVTNWVQPGPALRVVNGTTYNIAYSKLWGDLIKVAGYSGQYQREFLPMAYEARTKNILPDKIECDIYRQVLRDRPRNGGVDYNNFEFVETVVVFNFPDRASLVTGKRIGKCLCMKVDNYLTNGISMRAFDCGIQATNLVPVIAKEKAPVVSRSSETPLK